MTVFAPVQKHATPGKTHLYDAGSLNGNGAATDNATVEPDVATPPLCGMARSFGPFESVTLDDLNDLKERPDVCTICVERAAESLAE